jgi:hypothetical protein
MLFFFFFPLCRRCDAFFSFRMFLSTMFFLLRGGRWFFLFRFFLSAMFFSFFLDCCGSFLFFVFFLFFVAVAVLSFFFFFSFPYWCLFFLFFPPWLLRSFFFRFFLFFLLFPSLVSSRVSFFNVSFSFLFHTNKIKKIYQHKVWTSDLQLNKIVSNHCTTQHFVTI